MEILDELQIDRAVELLMHNEVVAFPTETVYGLGARIFSAEAIAKIFTLKRRPKDNPLIAHISDLQQLQRIVYSIPDPFALLADSFFPGPLTVILPAHPDVPHIATAGLPSIGVRMPQHPLALELIAKLGEPIVAPSANLSGKPSATSAQHVAHDFEGALSAVIDGGPCSVGVESTVLSLIDPERPILYRPGGVSKEQLEDVLKTEVLMPSFLPEHAPAPSPGLKYRHYAPEAKVSLFDSLEKLTHYHSLKKGKCLTLGPAPLEGILDYAVSRQTLFHLLRRADQEQYDEVLILIDSSLEKDLALMNRIQRAAHADH